MMYLRIILKTINMEKLRKYPRRKNPGSDYFCDYDLLETSLMLGGENTNESKPFSNENEYDHNDTFVNAIAFANLQRQTTD
jgi:hypothetical protein